MITISLCMIVKNEEKVIARCLDAAVNWADELIIVDTGSTDNTIAIARNYTDQIYHYEWVDDFAAARNYAFSLATKDYIMWLDADDVVEAEDQKKILELKKTLDPKVDSVTMLYHLAFDEFGNVTFSLRRNRLVKRARMFRWIGAVHEYLEVSGNIVASDIAIKHLSNKTGLSDRNLNIYRRRLAKGETFSPRDQFYYANELRDHKLYEEAVAAYEAFLKKGEGWIEDLISACGYLADCYHYLGNSEMELWSSLRSLQYDAPRPEYCCRIGFYFLQKKNYKAAITWYTLAIESRPPEDHMAFNNPSYSTWIPHLQLCVCYDRLGQYETACQHNELALQFRPNDPVMLSNRNYFKVKLNESINDALGGKQT